MSVSPRYFKNKSLLEGKRRRWHCDAKGTVARRRWDLYQVLPLGGHG